jgi:hypothetical protein
MAYRVLVAAGMAVKQALASIALVKGQGWVFISVGGAVGPPAIGTFMMATAGRVAAFQSSGNILDRHYIAVARVFIINTLALFLHEAAPREMVWDRTKLDSTKSLRSWGRKSTRAPSFTKVIILVLTRALTVWGRCSRSPPSPRYPGGVHNKHGSGPHQFACLLSHL